MFTDRRKVKNTVVYSPNGILLSNKKEYYYYIQQHKLV